MLGNALTETVHSLRSFSSYTNASKIQRVNVGLVDNQRLSQDDFAAVLVMIVIAGKNLLEAEIGKELAIFSFEPAMPVHDPHIFVQSFPGAGERSIDGVLMIDCIMHWIEHVIPNPDFCVWPDVADDLRCLANVRGQ